MSSKKVININKMTANQLMKLNDKIDSDIDNITVDQLIELKDKIINRLKELKLNKEI